MHIDVGHIIIAVEVSEFQKGRLLILFIRFIVTDRAINPIG